LCVVGKISKHCEIILTGEREEVFVPTPDGVCPYKGLRFFDVEDAPAQSVDVVEQVIQKLAQAKLIVTSEQRKGQEKVAVVDVAHEALIRHWSRLRELLDNNREAIRTEQKIQAAAEEWRDKGKSKDYLLTGLRLGEADPKFIPIKREKPPGKNAQTFTR
jgi:hypothetical protein